MKSRWHRGVVGCLCLGLLSVAGFSEAFKLSPEGTVLEKTIAKRHSSWLEKAFILVSDRGLKHFTEAVHEEVTQRTYGCEGDPDVCGNPDIGFASAFVIAGVRWNDDPPFQFETGTSAPTSCKVTETVRFLTQPKCWYDVFREAQSRAAKNQPVDTATKSPMLARSHFGDLQFLHAMASMNGERAAETRERVLMWTEFAWRVATGEFTLALKLRDVKTNRFSEFFGTSGRNVQDLFSLGNPTLRPRIHEVAFGSLLHTIQDSFAKGHVDRAEPVANVLCPGSAEAAPGRILSFRSYTQQDLDKHAEYDSRTAFAERWTLEHPSVVDVGRVLRQYFEKGSSWTSVKPYVECLFIVEDADAKATPGAGLARQ